MNKQCRTTARAIAIIGGAAATLVTAASDGANLLPNGNFQKPTAGIVPGTLVTYTSPAGGSGDTPQSAAADWLMFINDDGGNTITTEMIPSTFPKAPPGTMMLHVTVSARDSGLVTSTLLNQTGTLFTCVWLYIAHGAVGVGSGFEAFTEPNLVLDRQGTWEYLDVSNQGTGPYDITNTTVIYAEPSRWDGNLTSSLTDFYVQKATLRDSHGECKPF